MIAIVTGGAASGKSEYAENLAMSLGKNRVYIATMQPFDEECHRRIARHREMRREKGFTTVECFTDLDQLDLPADSVVLLECMSNLLANEFYREGADRAHLAEHILRGVRHLAETCGSLVVVTNEVFSDGLTYDPETARYLEIFGAVNRGMSALADQVTEVVYTVPVHHKKKENPQ